MTSRGSSPADAAPNARDFIEGGAALCINGAEDRLQLFLAAPLTTPPADGYLPGGERAHASGWKPLAFLELPTGGRANPVLAPAVAALLRMARVHCAGPKTASPKDSLPLRGVACVRGPGSFTGLRLTLAYALGLAEAQGLPMAGVDWLPLQASAALPALAAVCMEDAPAGLLMVSHARRRQVFIQSFLIEATPTSDDGSPAALRLVHDDAPRVVRTAALPEAADALRARVGERLFWGGSGVARNEAALASLFEAADAPRPRALHDAQCSPGPEAWLRTLPLLHFRRAPIEAAYLRGSDAEENLPALARARGLDAAQAERRFRELLQSSPPR